ncbi:putative transcription factor bHLH family [Medicago truncatula]|nr:transcription factor UPBEAT1 [Medicago truncatula]AFK44426.1 unknown [Medicago truncatula]RHN50174.1 putative transcription factor bHLH family [Medicago truncatula]
MSTNTQHSYKLSVKKATRRTRRRKMEEKCKSKKKLSQKLKALKNLIPSNNGDEVKTDELFKETADYIVFLRTRVLILQKLVEIYGNNTENNEHDVLL